MKKPPVHRRRFLYVTAFYITNLIVDTVPVLF